MVKKLQLLAAPISNSDKTPKCIRINVDEMNDTRAMFVNRKLLSTIDS